MPIKLWPGACRSPFADAVTPPTIIAFSIAPTRPDTWEGLADLEAAILRSYAAPLLSLSR